MIKQTLEQAVELAEKRNLFKQCMACAKRGINSRMVLDKKENWFKCTRCNGVRPVDTTVKLFWTYCPNKWRDNTKVKLIKIGKNIHRFIKCKITNKKFKKITFTSWCLYPKLITEEQKGVLEIKCVYCGHIYRGS